MINEYYQPAVILLLRFGGMLFTFSCSGGIDAALFQKIVASAALDAGVDATIIEHLSQGSDQPVNLHSHYSSVSAVVPKWPMLDFGLLP